MRLWNIAKFMIVISVLSLATMSFAEGNKKMGEYNQQASEQYRQHQQAKDQSHFFGKVVEKSYIFEKNTNVPSVVVTLQKPEDDSYEIVDLGPNKRIQENADIQLGDWIGVTGPMVTSNGKTFMMADQLSLSDENQLSIYRYYETQDRMPASKEMENLYFEQKQQQFHEDQKMKDREPASKRREEMRREEEQMLPTHKSIYYDNSDVKGKYL